MQFVLRYLHIRVTANIVFWLELLANMNIDVGTNRVMCFDLVARLEDILLRVGFPRRIYNCKAN